MTLMISPRLEADIRPWPPQLAILRWLPFFLFASAPPRRVLQSVSSLLPVLSAIAASLLGGSAYGSSRLVSDQDLLRKIDEAQRCRDTRLKRYTVTEKLHLSNSRFPEAAELSALVTYVQGQGKTYQIQSRTGPRFLQQHILEELLQTQVRISAPSVRQQFLITSANYRMRLTSVVNDKGRRCFIVELIPKRRSPYLLEGKAWIEAEHYSPIQVQGKTSATFSFLTGRPSLDSSYEQTEGMEFAAETHAVSQSFWLGRSQLTIRFENYQIIAASPADAACPNSP